MNDFWFWVWRPAGETIGGIALLAVLALVWAAAVGLRALYAAAKRALKRLGG